MSHVTSYYPVSVEPLPQFAIIAPFPFPLFLVLLCLECQEVFVCMRTQIVMKPNNESLYE